MEQIVKPANDRELVLTRVLNATPAQLFKAWTTPEIMTQWFAPKPFQLVVNKIDFRPGGRFEMAMRGPGGPDFPFSGVYRIVEPPSRRPCVRLFRNARTRPRSSTPLCW